MKKIVILATSALLITGVTFSIDNGKKKSKAKKRTVQKERPAVKVKQRIFNPQLN